MKVKRAPSKWRASCADLLPGSSLLGHHVKELNTKTTFDWNRLLELEHYFHTKGVGDKDIDKGPSPHSRVNCVPNMFHPNSNSSTE